MSNEPMAGGNLDPELLAAYIDKRLTPEQRAAVEAELAADPDNYAVLVETMKALDDVKSPEVHKAPRVPKVRWMLAGSLIGAAATLFLVVSQPEWLRRIQGDTTDPQLAKLVAAVGQERYFEARVAGGFEFAPVRVTRGAGPAANLALTAAASELSRRATANPTTSNRHLAAVALLQLGDYDGAVRDLESIVLPDRNAAVWNDLAAAYVTLAQRDQDPNRAASGIQGARTALSIDPNLTEARFNLALATEIAGSRDEAIKLWTDYLARESNEGWRREAAARLEQLNRAR